MRNFFIKKSLIIFMASVCFVSITTADDSFTEGKSKSLLRELVDSYVDSLNTDSILKYLLDAKMYLNTAGHDLLVSHDKEKAQSHIENALNYLLEAEKVAEPSIKQQLEVLVKNLKGLEQKTAKIALSGADNETDKLLEDVNNTLLKAKQKATISTQKDIDEIVARINVLRSQIEQANLRSDYESAMQSLNSIINNL